jgi:hypothetical protein
VTRASKCNPRQQNAGHPVLEMPAAAEAASPYVDIPAICVNCRLNHPHTVDTVSDRSELLSQMDTPKVQTRYLGQDWSTSGLRGERNAAPVVQAAAQRAWDHLHLFGKNITDAELGAPLIKRKLLAALNLCWYAEVATRFQTQSDAVRSQTWLNMKTL